MTTSQIIAARNTARNWMGLRSPLTLRDIVRQLISTQ